MATKAQLAQYCADHFPNKVEAVTQTLGVTYMTCAILVTAGVLISGIAMYFVGKRGLTGTKTDLVNAENSVKKVVTEATTAAHAAEASVVTQSN